MKKTLIATLFAFAALAAFALPSAPPPVAEPAPDAAKLTAELADAKALLTQTQTAAQAEITRLTVLAERNELAYRLQAAQAENLALRNALAQEQAKTLEQKSRYDMEKTKVEALLKAHPTESVHAEAKK